VKAITCCLLLASAVEIEPPTITAKIGMCAPRDRVLAAMQERNQHLAGEGLSNNGTILQMWATRGLERFSWVEQFPDGDACIIDQGRDWDSNIFMMPQRGT
jgi:hypothetical protein